MKRLLLTVLGLFLLTVLLPPTSAYAAEQQICGEFVQGGILTTANRAAGSGSIEEKFGCPIAPKTKIVVSSRNTYHQHFERGVVYWDGLQGGKWWLTDSAKPNLSGVSNDRDALYRYGFRGGMLLRSAKLNYITVSSKRLLVAQMHGGIVLDLRETGTADPNFSQTTEIRTGIPGHASGYSRYVTGTKERAGIAKALQVIASSGDRPIWVHCAAGRDRTGVVVSLVLSILGADRAIIEEEYLRTGSAEATNLNQFFSTVENRYGSDVEGVEAFLRSIGVTDADMSLIRTKFSK